MNGNWGKQRIFSNGWVEESTKRIVQDVAPDDPNMNLGYGYLWWLYSLSWVSSNHSGMLQVYGGRGYGGQYIFVVPELDIVAVINGWNIYGKSLPSVDYLFMEQIIPAVREGVK